MAEPAIEAEVVGEAAAAPSLHERWAALPAGLRDAVELWAVWRLPLALWLGATAAFVPQGSGSTGMGLPVNPLTAWARWDSGWYLSVVVHGYAYAPGHQSSIAFFPGYPMLARGLAATGLSPVAALVLVANASLFFALWGVHELAEEKLGAGAGRRAQLALLVFPTAFVLTAAYAEPLFLALAAWSLVSFERGRPLPAAALAALSALVRPHGVVLVGSLTLAWAVRREWKAAALAAGLGALALGAWCGWQEQRFGDALAFLHAREAWLSAVRARWGVTGYNPLPPLWHYTWDAVRLQWAFEGLLDLGAVALLVGAAAPAFRLGLVHGLVVVGTLVATIWNGQLWGLSRLAIGATPLFVVFAGWRAPPRRVRLAVGLSFAVCAMECARFVNGYWAG